ncbi:MAG: hypothetical protein NUV51_03675 [Sulfuricaulis sp.]|nr:hypothetical protein [Sulfuricaulis sp.]
MDYEQKQQPETLQAAIDALGLTYSAEFVPWSKSRNAKKPPVKPSDYSLNWKITISKGGRSITTDYSAGIGHIPGYKQSWSGRLTVDEFEAIKYACETGKTYRAISLNLGSIPMGQKPILAPSVTDVMSSLILDASVLDAGVFEEWAGDYGYDTDSREAERIYKACLDIALKLRSIVGDAGLAALREACTSAMRAANTRAVGIANAPAAGGTTA